jgi:hypothetical protein
MNSLSTLSTALCLGFHLTANGGLSVTNEHASVEISSEAARRPRVACAPVLPPSPRIPSSCVPAGNLINFVFRNNSCESSYSLRTRWYIP